jgi:hypothetical protein
VGAVFNAGGFGLLTNRSLMLRAWRLRVKAGPPRWL